jgi:hypothetical protein
MPEAALCETAINDSAGDVTLAARFPTKSASRAAVSAPD